MFLMLGCSLILHGAVVLIATAEWGFSRRKSDFAPVYSVELVTLPSPSAKKNQKFYTGSKAKAAARQQAIPINRWWRGWRFLNLAQPLFSQLNFLYLFAWGNCSLLFLQG